MPEAVSPKDIRETLDYDLRQWRKIRDEGRTDMRFLLGDPWDPAERAARLKLGRPTISFDELHQYVNQLLNDVRQNKRSIKVMPDGPGSTDKTAELREKRIRRIEYDSNAQSAYITAFEGAVQRSYGCFRLNTAFKGKTFDQEIVIRRIANPDTVVFDWDCKEMDCSDADHLTAIDYIPKEQFKRRFPKATKTSFTAHDMQEAEGWIRERDIRVAEAWRVKKTNTKLFLVETGTPQHSQPVVFTEEELKQIERPGSVLKERDFEERQVCQYITNGIEILEENEWAGNWIPYIPVFGRELYADEGNGAERKLLSLVRLARDPFMTYCWIRTNMMECVGQSPKSLYIGYKGQFNPESWKNINRDPKPYAEVEMIMEGVGNQLLPLPRREQYEPPLQSLELFAEATRRAIQAAMGISPLPTQAQRQNEKSGVALERIEKAEDQGTFHFIDNFNNSLEFAGRQICDLLDKVEDTPRDVGLTANDGTQEMARINDPQWVDPETKQTAYHIYGGEHEVTVSTGPSYQSEREEAASFADTILPNIEQLPLDPATKGRFLALVIKLRNLGPLGDAMAEILSPEQNEQMPPQAMALVNHGKQIIEQLQQQVGQLVRERESKSLELQARRQIEQDKNASQLQLANLDRETKLAVAEIETKAQNAIERFRILNETWKELHGGAHEAALQSMEHDHEQLLAQQAQEAAAQQPQETA